MDLNQAFVELGNDKVDDFKREGYTQRHANCEGKRGVGVVLYVDNGL